MSRTRFTILALTCAVTLVGFATAQVKRTLKPDDYKQWQTLQDPHISNDGRWLSYQIDLVDGDGHLEIRNSDAPQKADVTDAQMAQFSDDSKWCGYLISPSKAEVEKLREQKKPIEMKFALRDLASGRELGFDGVRAFRFIKGSKTVLLARYPGAGKPMASSDFVSVDLTTGEPLTIGNVIDAEPNHDGNLIAFLINSDSGQKGVQILDRSNDSIKTLAWGKDAIYRMTWAGKADVLGFMAGKSDDKKDGDANVVLLVSDFRKPQPTFRTFDPAKQSGFPTGSRVSELAPLAVSDDGSIVGFGAAEWNDKKKPDPKPQDKPGVEVWNTLDVREMPQQKVEEARDKAKTRLCMWHADTNVLQVISDGKQQLASILPGFDKAMIVDPTPYAKPANIGLSFHDVWLVNTVTGEKTKVMENSQWLPVPSRKGRYLAYFDRKNWWLYDIKAEKKTNVTASIKEPFQDVDDDHTIVEKPAWSTPTWLANDDGVILEDKYDCYLVRTGTNSITELTNGRKDKQIYRFLTPEPSEDGPSLQKPFFCSIFDDVEKASGFYKCDSQGKGKVLVLDNRSLRGLVKAKDVDRMVFLMGSFAESPNLYLTNTEMTATKPESKTNPQQANFLWGHEQLVKYKSRWGVDLQGSLFYPADYVKGRSYPMITLIYEKVSGGLHNYAVPSDSSAYNVQVLSQNGYFVYMPDIVYKPRNPGLSAVDCLEPAVAAVLALRVGVDSTKVGLMGHSWGAYQTAFVTTVSKVFAAGVAGAPLTELISMYNSFYWNAGVTDQQIFESSQGRMGVPFWEDPKVYIDNSPVWQSAKRTAPIMFAAGDQDGAVDWHQSQYLFNTLRRMGKNAVMLLYAGENHSLAKKANQLDYAHRLRHFFDVYLKGAKPEPWVNQDVPLIQQENQ